MDILLIKLLVYHVNQQQVNANYHVYKQVTLITIILAVHVLMEQVYAPMLLLILHVFQVIH